MCKRIGDHTAFTTNLFSYLTISRLSVFQLYRRCIAVQSLNLKASGVCRLYSVYIFGQLNKKKKLVIKGCATPCIMKNNELNDPQSAQSNALYHWTPKKTDSLPRIKLCSIYYPP